MVEVAGRLHRQPLLKIILSHHQSPHTPSKFILIRFQDEINRGIQVPWPDHDESTKNW